ncbi:MAG: tachylectin-related carbohydrate-binding protein [Kineosporiaceae bacterium]
MRIHSSLRRRPRLLAALNVAGLTLALAVAVPVGLTASPAHATQATCPSSSTTTDEASIRLVSVSGTTVSFTSRAMKPIATSTSALQPVGSNSRIPQIEKFARVLVGPSNSWLVGVAASGTSITSGSTADTTGGLWVWRYANSAWGNPAKVTDSVEFKAWAGSAKNMISMDSGYNIWTVDTSGRLRISPLDITNRLFPTGKLKLMSTEYAGTDYLVAAGTTVLWSRTTAGDLYRTQYDTPSARRLTARTKYGTGFSSFTTILSPGYDVLYTVTSTGGVKVWKFDYKGDTYAWPLQRTATGTAIAAYKHIWVANSYCSAPADVTPAPDLSLTGTAGDAPAVVQWQSGDTSTTSGQAGRVDAFYVDGAGQLVMSANTDRELGSGTWSRSVVHGGNYINGPAVARLDRPTSTSGVETEYVFAHRYNGHVLLFTRTTPLSAFPAPVDLQGRFSGAPVAVRRSDNSAAVVAAHGTQVWGRARPSDSADFAAWERLVGASGTVTPSITGDVAAAPLDNGLVAVAGRGTDGLVWIGVWNPVSHGTTWSSLPAIASVGTPSLASASGRLRVAVTLAPTAPATTATVATMKQSVTGAWETAWTTVAGADTALAPSVGFGGYEGVWYLAATGADSLLSTARETTSGGTFGSFGSRFDVAFPPPATSTAVASSPAVFTLTNAAGAAQAAVAVVNSDGFATAVKLNTSLNPQAHVARAGARAKG